MSAGDLVQRMIDGDDQTNLCVVLRSGANGIEVLLVADEIGRWSIPGGHAKDNETRQQACKREVKEESNLDVDPEPLFLADHSARKLPAHLFYAVVNGGDDAKPGGGDVTEVKWVTPDNLGDLNGTDRLAISVAVNRVHSLPAVVEESVEKAEELGYAVATVAAPPEIVPGIHFRLNGKSANDLADHIKMWAESLGWTTLVVDTIPYISTGLALTRASQTRRLTPVLECLIRVSDSLWRYDRIITPALKAGHIVLEVGPEIDEQRLLQRGLERDLWNHIRAQMPKPSAAYTVDDLITDDFRVIKDSIEHAKNPDDPKYHVDRLTQRDVQVPWKMEFVRDNPNERDNPIVRCPKCKHEGKLMDDFSYLAAGFNGIEPNSEDDLDAQECGHCGAKMEWQHIDNMIGLNPEGN